MFLSVVLCSVMGLVLTSTCVLCAGLLAPTTRATGTLSLHPPDPVTSKDQEPLETSYLHLPVFLHFRKPRVDKAHFSPTHTKSRKLIPKRVRQILVPEPRRRAKARGRARGPMTVSCDSKEMRVRVDRANLEAGMHVRLGTCDVSGQTEQSVLFRYELHACGTQEQILNETLVYSNMLHYTPDSSGFGSDPHSVPVQCHFNRFHYSYKVGYVPSVESLKFLKPIKTKASVSLALFDAQWNRLPPSQAVVIGQPIHFEAEALYVPEDQRLYLSSCHVTANSSSVLTPQVKIIDNYGCLMDSKRSSRSRFISSASRNVVRFIIDAFSLQGEEQKYLLVHCEMSIKSLVPTETSKLCSFNQLERRWEELNGADAVCLCCDSSCVSEIPTMIRPLMSDLKSLVKQHPEQQVDPVQNPEGIHTPEPKQETALRENLLTTDVPERTLRLEQQHGTIALETMPMTERSKTAVSEHRLITLNTPPTPESKNEALLPGTLPMPTIPLWLDSDHQPPTPVHKSTTLTPEHEHVKVTLESRTPVPSTKREKFTLHTHAVTPSVQQTTITTTNTRTVLHEPYLIFEEVFGLG